MNTLKNTQQEEQLTPAEQVKSDWRSLVDKMSYRAVISNIPFLGFLAILCILYINNNHRAIQMQREMTLLNKNTKVLRWKYMDIKSQLMNTKMETEVIRNAANMGLKPLVVPAYKIENDLVKK